MTTYLPHLVYVVFGRPLSKPFRFAQGLTIFHVRVRRQVFYYKRGQKLAFL